MKLNVGKFNKNTNINEKNRDRLYHRHLPLYRFRLDWFWHLKFLPDSIEMKQSGYR